MMAYYRNVNTLFGGEDIIYQNCSCCGEEKLLEDFYTRDIHKRIDTRCKTCHSETTKLTRSLRSQNGNKNTGYCDCCGIYKGRNKLRVDHDHETNLFRGWLCENCNTGIGRLGDNEEGLKKALNYLKCHKEKNLAEAKLFGD